MAYTKTDWVNGETPINADNLNKIENQLETNTNTIESNKAELDGEIETNTTDISNLQSTVQNLQGNVQTNTTNIQTNTTNIGDLSELDSVFGENVDLVVALNFLLSKLKTNATITEYANGTKLFDLFGFRIIFGRWANITVPASSYTSLNIIFPKAFVSTPTVIAVPQGNYNISCQIGSVDNEKFVLNVRSNDGNERTGRTYAWVAIGV